MDIPEEYKGILVVALIEFKSQQVDFLYDFVNRYHDSMNCDDLRAAFNCVHLYEKADLALDVIGGQK